MDADIRNTPKSCADTRQQQTPADQVADRRNFLRGSLGAGLTAAGIAARWSASVALPSVLLGLSGCGDQSGRMPSPLRPTPIGLTDAEIAESVLLYAAHPVFSGEGLIGKLTGTQADLKLLDRRDSRVYLSYPYVEDTPRTEAVRVLCSLSKNPAAVEVAELRGNTSLEFPDGMGAHYTRAIGTLVRFPIEDFQIDRNARAVVTFPSGIEYDITAEELARYAKDRCTRNGLLTIETERRGQTVYGISNQDPYVALPGEPSLERFVARITTGVATREGRIQKLTDFVTRDIRYSEADASRRVETYKRPNEVILAGEADCSGKVALLASFLNQIGEPYVYLHDHDPSRLRRGGADHIALAVPTGEFTSSNGISGLTLGDEVFIYVEAAASGFQIGKSRLEKGDVMATMTHIQYPGKDEAISINR